MPDTTSGGSIPPIEPQPAVAPAAPPPPPAPPMPAPPVVDPYAQVAPPVPPGYGPPTYAPAYQVGYYGTPQPPRGVSITSMVLGIAGVFFSFFYGFGLVPSIAAVITGHIARKRQPHARGMSLAGLICGYIGLGISLLWIVLFIGLLIWGLSTGGDFGSYSRY